MIKQVNASGFMLLSASHPVIDVRSESEFSLGHVPGAINIPLFNDDERAIVGTLYKNSGRETSVLKGLEIAGPKLSGLVKQLNMITDQKQILLHCWRGGMRSESMAWLFDKAGYDVFLLSGGYKAYRHFIHEIFRAPYKLVVVGGKTGSAKTAVLQGLEKAGEQVVDLETLAHHKGSAFGGREDGFQPTNEQFYNELFNRLYSLDVEKTIWVEDESRTIGRVSIPDEFFSQMGRSPLMYIDCKPAFRIGRLVEEYGVLPAEQLVESLKKVREKIGGDKYKIALEALGAGNFRLVAELMLGYYDKAYEHSLSGRFAESVFTFIPPDNHPEGTPQRLIEFVKQIK